MTEGQERALTEGLKALAARSRHAGASPRVEAAVLAGMAGRPVSRRAGPFVPLVSAALVALSLSGAWLAHRVVPEREVRPAGFVEVPGASALPPLETGVIVRVTLPLTALPQYGLAIPADAATDLVEADLLVAQDGIPRAARMALDTQSSRSTP